MREFVIEELVATGDEGEDLLVSYLEARGFEILERSDGYFPGWDLHIMSPRGVQYTVEVKNQPEADRFGTINIEILEKGEASGLLLSTADLWAHRIGADPVFYVWTREDLLAWAMLESPRRVNGGREGTATSLLMDNNEFKRRAAFKVSPPARQGGKL